jgi:uronate dehydrogenase
VPRVVVASSHHVVGLLPLPTQGLLADDVPARPDSYYGVSKAAVEALASLYHDRYGIDIVCLRIGSYRPRPDSRRTLWSWLSPGDCVRLFEAALAVASPGYCVVWGLSANRRGVVSLEGGRAIGYAPRDDAERYVHEVLSIDPVGELSPHVGGPYAAGNVDVD